MKREDILEFFHLIVRKGLREGFSYQDYHCLQTFKKYLHKKDSLYQDISSLLIDICQDGNPFWYSKESISYVKSHAYLLPLVLANNEKTVKMYGENSYLFSCQFHDDTQNSMSVTDYINLLHCFQYHVTYDAVSYLQTVEELTFLEAMDLLIGIYCLDGQSLEGQLALLVEKYQSALLGTEYARLLELGYVRFAQNSQFEIGEFNVDHLYQERFDTILRVRRKEVDSQFHGSRNKERFFLN